MRRSASSKQCLVTSNRACACALIHTRNCMSRDGARSVQCSAIQCSECGTIYHNIAG